MKQIQPNLRAFTLTETLVAMALMGMVSLTGAFLIRSTFGAQARYHEQMERTWRFMDLWHIVGQDMKEAQSWQAIEPELWELERNGLPVGIRYESTPAGMVRWTQDEGDTLSGNLLSIHQDRWILEDSLMRLKYTFAATSYGKVR
ncbi:type II secretion system protein [Pontibacter sp. G13]|uniref:PulJ/GspJ family protein n=1 Tax=Pontibacter sp. G13 TaxID=3074898 RepID=UPI00288B9A09|nr:type II secretion system protein [Pontibacter sp. G13]WNJ21623.1 type II secretion system protein [Pontibacter sp. G13]